MTNGFGVFDNFTPHPKGGVWELGGDKFKVLNTNPHRVALNF